MNSIGHDTKQSGGGGLNLIKYFPVVIEKQNSSKVTMERISDNSAHRESREWSNTAWLYALQLIIYYRCITPHSCHDLIKIEGYVNYGVTGLNQSFAYFPPSRVRLIFLSVKSKT